MMASKWLIHTACSRGRSASRVEPAGTRLAMSWAYWAPKSTTRTVSNSVTGRPPDAGRPGPLVTHAHLLGPLEALALGLERGGHHDLRLLELLHRLVAARRHGRAQGAEQVQAAVVLVGRAEEDLLERAPDLGPHPGPSGQGGVEGGHAPVVAPTRGLVRRGQRGADHDRVGPAGDGLGDVASLAHAPVRDDLHVHAGLVQVAHAGPGGVGDGRGLGNPDAEHAPGGAGVAGADADQDANRPGA